MNIRGKILYIPDYGWCPMPNVALEFYPDRNSFYNMDLALGTNN